MSTENGSNEIQVTRVFDAPIEKVWEAWADPAHFKQWAAPTGLTMEFKRADIRPGGSVSYTMSRDGEVVMHGLAEYKVIEKPHRIAYVQGHCDEHEKKVRGTAMVWPLTMLATFDLAEEGPQRTRVTLTWTPYEFTQEELDTFIQAKENATQRWNGSFDKLEAYLK